MNLLIKPGDLLQPFGEVNGVRVYRCIYVSDKLPWHDSLGMYGKTHPFPYGSVGIYLQQALVETHPAWEVEGRRPKIFYKILTADGMIGWLPSNWVRFVQ